MENAIAAGQTHRALEFAITEAEKAKIRDAARHEHKNELV